MYCVVCSANLASLYFNVIKRPVIKINSNAVIFIGPFKISTDNYHTVDDSALCVYKQYGFSPTENGSDPFLFSKYMDYTRGYQNVLEIIQK